jgi:hypothetical protein
MAIIVELAYILKLFWLMLDLKSLLLDRLIIKGLVTHIEFSFRGLLGENLRGLKYLLYDNDRKS